jgi:protein-tyrosine phosphatase
MIDFHAHILPSTDDGSEDMDMSLRMLNISVSEGVDYICATPHFIVDEFEIDKSEYDTRLQQLKTACSNISMDILIGLEVYIHPDLPDLYKKGRIWGFNNTPYVLVELPMREFPLYTEEVLYRLRLEGAIPVIAHPERNLKILQNYKLLTNLVAQGTLVQMNAGSLTGMYGSNINKFADKLIDMNMVHLLGSDGHNDYGRTTKLKEAYRKVRVRNKRLFEWLLENEQNIIQGIPVEIPELREVNRTKKKFFWFFKS